MNLTYVELFAGAGGMSLGLEMAGWRCVAHAEIEPHARAVLRHHWPNVPLFGDVSQLDGRQFKGVTMLTGGSPCQDLSIAGKRAGMTEGSGTRSSLFFEQVRIWNEMEAPFILWENVYGAFSSNDGRDFATVLSAIVGGAVPVPADGWRGAGVASGPAGVAAWRTLDAQYFGVPQRRRRVFVLGSRDPRVDPAEVLSLAESLSGHFASSGKARQSSAADSGVGLASESGAGFWDDNGLARLRAQGGGTPQNIVYNRGFTLSADSGTGASGAVGVLGDISHALMANGYGASEDGTGRGTPVVVTDSRVAHSKANRAQGFSFSDSVGYLTDVMPTIPAVIAKGTGSQMMGVLTYSTPAIGDIREDSVASTITKNSGGGGETQNPAFVVAVDVYNQTINTDGIAHTIRAHNTGEGIPHMSLVMRQREGKPGGGKGPLLSAERSLTLGTSNDQVVFGTLQATDATKCGSNQWVEEGKVHLEASVPRRLTPMECERLMGWPDLHTSTGVNEKGKVYQLADTARYKLCGNGIASPVTAWIGFQLRAAVESL